MKLYKLLARGDRRRFSPTVLSLLGSGAIGARISGHGRARADPGHAPGAAAVAGDAAPDPPRALAPAIPDPGVDVPRQCRGKRLRPAVGPPSAGDLERQALDPRHALREPAQPGLHPPRRRAVVVDLRDHLQLPPQRQPA